jgi:hypothetical protein
LAWGLGTKGRLLRTRLDWFSRDPAAPTRLVQAWTAVRDERAPQECYETLLTPRGRPLIKYFGAAFATKYLYFAHGLTQTPKNVILDQVVATQLRGSAWPAAPTTGRWYSTYQHY